MLKYCREMQGKEAKRYQDYAVVGGSCERCGAVGEEVHHKKYLTPENVKDKDISVNQDNLELLCKQCHNEEHGRFSSELKFDDEGNLIIKSLDE